MKIILWKFLKCEYILARFYFQFLIKKTGNLINPIFRVLELDEYKEQQKKMQTNKLHKIMR